MIPFYRPYIDSEIKQAVCKAIESGWLSSGPLVRQFENELKVYTGAQSVICTGSAGMSLQMVLRYFGIQNGDEVILPAFTHPATANAVVLSGAKPVFADINPVDFTICPVSISKLINANTKAIIPVDIAGMPCDYNIIYKLIQSKKSEFIPASPIQEDMGRILLLADASHSFGATMEEKQSGTLADISVFSFHAVKNLTTGEGAAICFNLPQHMNFSKIADDFKAARVHGLTADAFRKLEEKTWEYDVHEPSGKSVLTDVAAAMGISLLKKYNTIILPRRLHLFNHYSKLFLNDSRYICPVHYMEDKNSSCHLYILQLNGKNKDQRNKIMRQLYDRGIITNLQFIPIPLLTWYKSTGYTTGGLENTMNLYSRCLSLPFFHDLNEEQMNIVCTEIKQLDSLII